jgi:hypothetical protein
MHAEAARGFGNVAAAIIADNERCSFAAPADLIIRPTRRDDILPASGDAPSRGRRLKSIIELLWTNRQDQCLQAF